MITITVEIPDLTRFTRDMEARVDRAVSETAEAAANDAKASMAGPKTGRTYRYGKVAHQASAPGEAPAIDTGQLVNSIRTRRLESMRWSVGTNTEYARHLEYGTKRMAARPFLRPAAERSRPEFVRRVVEALKGD